ncbi:MAG: SpoIIE family protein phosphatase [bacterium]|nr:SpoIIE family protein phosphatase [bacterium]
MKERQARTGKEMASSNQNINNRYEIIQPLAEKLFIRIFKVRDRQKGKYAILQQLKPESISGRSEDLFRFKKELTRFLTLTHPHILRVLDLGEEKGQYYYITEYMEGQSLSELFRQGKRFRIEEAADLMTQIVSALEYSHNEGLLHLDLRPSNIMIEGRTKKAKLTSFGLSHIMEYTQIRKPEEIASVFSYISPEQSGIMKRSSDERSDLYSAGVIFYELLTGEVPFKGNDIGSLLHQHMAKVPVSPRKVSPEIPEVIEEMVLKLLAKEPEARYQTAKGLLADLETYRNGNTSFVIGKQDRLKKLLFHTRLIGREEETKELKKSFNEAEEGNGRVVMIKGEPGMGKSRLVDEMRSYVYEGKGVFLSGRCFSQENKIPYLPYRDILYEFIDRMKKKEEGEREKNIKRLQEVMGELGEIVMSINPGLEEVFGKQPKLVHLDPEREHRRFLMVASKFFLNLGTKQEPYVYYMDDLQWSDEASLSLLEEILSQIKDFPVLVLGTYRDNEVDENHTLHKTIEEARGKQYPVAEIALKFFDEKRLNKFLSELLLEEEETTSELAKYILNKSKGNPFFSLEITRQIVEEKALQYDEEKKHWITNWDRLNALAISNNIVEVVLRRIQVLDKEKTKLLCYGSVAGREFPITLLQRLTGYEEEKLINLIDECIKLQFIEKSREKGRILFVHDRIRDAFYVRVPQGELKKIHKEIAESIEDLYQGNLESVLFDLAHHYAEADEKEKALTYCAPAANKAKANYANEEAIRYYQLQIRLLEEKGQTGTDIWLNANEELIDVYLTIGENDIAIKKAEQILPYKRKKLEQARIFRKIGTAYYKKGDWENCESYLAKGLKLLSIRIPIKNKEVVLPLLKEIFIHICHGLYPAYFKPGKIKKIKERDMEIVLFTLPLCWMYGLSNVLKLLPNIYKMLNMAEKRIGHSLELTLAQTIYGSTLGAIGFFKRGLLYDQMALDYCEQINNPYFIASAKQKMSFIHYWLCQSEKTLSLLKDALDVHRKVGDMWEIAMDLNIMGHMERYIGNYDTSINIFLEYLSISQKIKDNYGFSSCMSYLALAYLEKGDFEKAEEWNTKSLKISEPHKIEYNMCFGYIHMGYLYKEKGELKRAVDYLEKAKILFEKNLFLKDWTVIVYHHLADAYLDHYSADLAHASLKAKRTAFKKLKRTCRKAEHATRIWINHFGAALRVNAKYYALAGRKKRAEEYFMKSIGQTRKTGRRYELGRSLFEYGNFLRERGRQEEAKARWKDAHDVFREIGSKHYVERCEKLLGITTGPQAREMTAQERLAVERRLSTLVTVSHHLSSILDSEELLSRIVDSAIEVSGAERGFLFLYDEEKSALQVKIAHGLEQGVELIPLLDTKHYKLCRNIITEVRDKTASLLFNPQVSPDLMQDEDIRTYRIKSIICTALKVRGEVLGLLYLDNRLVEEAFDEQDLNLINSLAIQAGISLQNAFFVKEMVEKERLSEELKLGRQIQTTLLPQKNPEAKGLVVEGLMQPAREIGGDYYDFISLPENKLGIVIGDVSGKGVAAGLLMSMVKTAIHIFSAKIKSPKEVLLNINQVINQHIGGEKFMTLLYLVWDPATSSITYSSAGHEHILIWRESEGKLETVVSGGIILGVMPDISHILEDKKIKLEKGDKILLYTDGVTEAHNEKKERFGLERLQKIFKNNSRKSVPELIRVIKEETFSFIGSYPQYDDITLAVLEA